MALLQNARRIFLTVPAAVLGVAVAGWPLSCAMAQNVVPLLPGFTAPAPYEAPDAADFARRAVPAPAPQSAPVRNNAPVILRPPAGMAAATATTPSAALTPVILKPPQARSAMPPENTSAPIILRPPVGTAAKTGGYDKDAPVDLTADSMQHDDRSGIVTASGNVELLQAGRRLQAREVSYNLNDGTARARGNVVLTDANGDKHFADEAELSEEMSTGFVNSLESYLADGGQFKARRGERHSEKDGARLLTMHEASYTPCNCDLDAGGNPTWRIRADSVTYDEDAHKISYKNAKLDLFGTPVFWTPYLAHSDGKAKRKSGFLSPSGGYSSKLGLIVTQNYYIDIAPDRDMTVGTMLTTEQMPVALAEYRQRWANGEFKINGSLTHSDRTDSSAGENVAIADEWRGHVIGAGRWELTEKWRAGMTVEVASDDQYLRQYDFNKKDVLESSVYAERFSGRNYASIRGMAFQDVRVQEEQSDQPHILPEAQLQMLGEPGGVLGGRWEVNASALGLMREGSGQDMARAALQLGWQRRDTTSFGLVNTLDLSVRGDAYAVEDRDVALTGSGRSRSTTQSRFFPQAHMVSSLPLVKPLEKSQILIEPLAALTVGTNVDSAGDAIPNEDSQDVQIDSTNLFRADRFPGLDRIEDRARVTYGLRGGVYGHQGSHVTGFIGQSYNFDKDDNPFPAGSGLSQQESDYVGSLSALYNNNFGVNYRFQIGSDSMTSQRHEFDSYATWQKLSLAGRYLFAKGLGGTSIDDSREQLEAGLAYFFTDSWRARSAALYDLGDDAGLRRAIFGLDYYGCCMNLSLTAERNVTTDSSGDDGTRVMFRIGLKGLGDFYTAEDHQWGMGGTPLLGRVR